jgi:hypothetical protein
MKNIFLTLLILFIIVTACSDPSGGSGQDENNPPATDDPLAPVNEPDAKEITFSLAGSLAEEDSCAGPVRVSRINNNCLYIGYIDYDTNIVEIYDLANPLNPQLMGQLEIKRYYGRIKDIFIKDGLVFLALGMDGIAIFDVSEPFNPEPLSNYFITEAEAVFVQGDYLFCGEGDNFYIFNISKPSNPILIAIIEPYSNSSYVNVSGIYVSGDYAYVTGNNNSQQYLAVVGIKDPYNPTVKKRYTGNQWLLNGNTGIKKLVIKNNYAYLATFDGLVIFDVSDPLNITEAGFYGTPWGLYNIVIDGNYAYCSMYDQDNERFSLMIIDIEDPFLPVEVSTTPAGTFDFPIPLSIYKGASNTFAYCHTKEGINVLDVSDPSDVEEAILISRYDSSYNKILVNGDYAYMTNGNAENSLAVFNISNPAAPFITGKLSAESTGVHDFNAVDIVLCDNYAYLKISRDDYYNSEDLAIVNITDKENPAFIGFVPDISCIQGFTVFENTMYIFDIYNTIIMLDLTDPANPSTISEFEIGNKSANQYSSTDIYVNRKGLRILSYIVYKAGTIDLKLSIIDLTDPLNPVVSGNLTVPEIRADKIIVRDNILFFISNHNYDYSIFYTIDVSDKGNPVLIDRYEFPIKTHLTGMNITGDFAIFSMLDKGICALDISNPARPLYSASFNHRNDSLCTSLDIKENHIYVANGASDESLFVLGYR